MLILLSLLDNKIFFIILILIIITLYFNVYFIFCQKNISHTYMRRNRKNKVNTCATWLRKCLPFFFQIIFFIFNWHHTLRYFLLRNIFFRFVIIIYHFLYNNFFVFVLFFFLRILSLKKKIILWNIGQK